MREIYKSLILLFVSCVVFINTLDGNFVFDDQEAILNNADVSKDTHWSVMITNDFWGTDVRSNRSHKSYRPFAVWTFRMNKYWSGNVLVARDFKLTNLIIHVITVQVVSAYLTIMFPDILSISLKKVSSDKVRNLPVWHDIPFLTTLLFSVHPIHVEAVSGIVGRADLLCALFFFLTLLCYYVCIPPKERGFEGEDSRGRKFYKWFFYLCVLVFVHLATYSKEIGVTALMMCMAYEFVIIKKVDVRTVLEFFNFVKSSCNTIRENVPRNPRDGRFKQQETVAVSKWARMRKHTAMMKRICVLLIVFAYFVISRLWFLDFKAPTFQITDNPAAHSDKLVTKILTYNYIYFLNVLLLVWPHWLCYDWSMGCVPLLTSARDPRLLCVLLFWGFIAALLYGASTLGNTPRQRRMLTMVLCMIVIPYLPASNIVVVVGLVIAERILYIPSLGMCLLVAWGTHALISSRNRSTRQFAKFFFMFVIVTYALRTNQRGKEWMNEPALFESGLEVCPLNAKVRYNIAKIAVDQGDFERGEREYRKAIELHPQYYFAMNNLANMLRDQDRNEEAKKYLYEAVRIKEDFPAAWMNLGIILTRLGQYQLAESSYKRALAYRKNYTDCFYNLGNLYLHQGMNNLAIHAWIEAINTNKMNVNAWANLLSILYNTEQIDRGLEFADEALALHPHSEKVCFTVGNLKGRVGKYEEAERCFLEAIKQTKHKPNFKYYSNLGVLYHRWEKYDKATKMYKIALKMSNNAEHVMDNIKKLPSPYLDEFI